MIVGPEYQSQLNIKTVVLIRTPHGYILKKDATGCYFPVGKNIQMGETCHEAIKRGVLEEVGYGVTDLEFIAVHEHFLSVSPVGPCHEIAFIYKTEVTDVLELPEGYHTVSNEHIGMIDIWPISIKAYILDEK